MNTQQPQINGNQANPLLTPASQLQQQTGNQVTQRQLPTLPQQPNGQQYLKGGIDTNDILRAKLDPDFYEGYCIGSIHKRLHSATSLYRNDPQGRQREYRSVLYYAQQLLQNLGQPPQPIDFEDLAQRFQQLPTNANSTQPTA